MIREDRLQKMGASKQSWRALCLWLEKRNVIDQNSRLSGIGRIKLQSACALKHTCLPPTIEPATAGLGVFTINTTCSSLVASRWGWRSARVTITSVYFSISSRRDGASVDGLGCLCFWRWCAPRFAKRMALVFSGSITLLVNRNHRFPFAWFPSTFVPPFLSRSNWEPTIWSIQNR